MDSQSLCATGTDLKFSNELLVGNANSGNVSRICVSRDASETELVLPKINFIRELTISGHENRAYCVNALLPDFAIIF